MKAKVGRVGRAKRASRTVEPSAAVMEGDTAGPWSADRIKALRSRLEMTQEEFGAELSVHAGTVKKWEGGRAEPRAKQRRAMRELAARHGVTLASAAALPV